MPTATKQDLHKLATSLHKSGVVNLNTKVGDILKVDPKGPVSDNAVAWSDYILITKGKPANLAQIGRVARAVRGAGR